MKRLRYLVVALLFVSLVALTGCTPKASQIEGKWATGVAVGNVDKNILTIDFGEGVGYGLFGVFGYSFPTTVTWGSDTWTIDANEKAKNSDEFPEGSYWIGAAGENALGVWKNASSETIKDSFELIASLDGEKLYISDLIINGEIIIDHEEYGPEYLAKR